jgi:hypothetical protein
VFRGRFVGGRLNLWMQRTFDPERNLLPQIPPGLKCR